MGPNHTHNAWTIEPLPGARFVNQLAGEVTLYFPRGQEKAMHDHVIKAVHEAYKRSLGLGAPAPAPATSAPLAAPAAPAITAHPPVVPSGPPGTVPRQRTVKMQDGSESVITEYVPAAEGPHVTTPLNPHPLDQLRAAPPAPAASPEVDPEIEAILGASDTLPPPPALTRCPEVHAMNEDYEVQCSLAPHTTGQHAAKVGDT